MGDSCICNDYDHDGPEFANERIVKAREAHKCCECRKEIEPGQRYEYVSGKWDGYFMTFKTCLACKHTRDSLMSCGWVYGRLWEDVRDWFESQGIKTDDEDTDESWLL